MCCNVAATVGESLTLQEEHARFLLCHYSVFKLQKHAVDFRKIAYNCLYFTHLF